MKKKVGHFNGMKPFAPEGTITQSLKGKELPVFEMKLFAPKEDVKYYDKIVNSRVLWSPIQPLKSIELPKTAEQLLKDVSDGFIVSTVKLSDRVETLVIKRDDPDFHFLVAYFFAEYGEEESIKLGLVQHSLAVKQFIPKNRLSVFFIRMLKFLRKVFL